MPVEITGPTSILIKSQQKPVIQVQPKLIPAIAVSAPGPQGKQGPPGPQGPPGSGSVFRYDQSSPAGVWTVAHNLGRSVMVQVFIGGQLVIVDVDETNPNILSVVFATPQSGYVLYS